MPSGAASSRRTCKQTCCHRPTYSLGRCRSGTRGFAASFQMHCQVLSSSWVGGSPGMCCYSGCLPPGGPLTSGGPAGCGKEGGWLGPFCLCRRAGPISTSLRCLRGIGVGSLRGSSLGRRFLGLTKPSFTSVPPGLAWAILSNPLSQKLPGSVKAISRDFVAMLGDPKIQSLALSGSGCRSEWGKPVHSPEPLLPMNTHSRT